MSLEVVHPCVPAFIIEGTCLGLVVRVVGSGNRRQAGFVDACFHLGPGSVEHQQGHCTFAVSLLYLYIWDVLSLAGGAHAGALVYRYGAVICPGGWIGHSVGGNSSMVLVPDRPWQLLE